MTVACVFHHTRHPQALSVTHRMVTMNSIEMYYIQNILWQIDNVFSSPHLDYQSFQSFFKYCQWAVHLYPFTCKSASALQDPCGAQGQRVSWLDLCPCLTHIVGQKFALSKGGRSLSPTGHCYCQTNTRRLFETAPGLCIKEAECSRSQCHRNESRRTLLWRDAAFSQFSASDYSQKDGATLKMAPVSPNEPTIQVCFTNKTVISRAFGRQELVPGHQNEKLWKHAIFRGKISDPG